MPTRVKIKPDDATKLTRSWLSRVAGDRDSYATADVYEGALLGTLAAWELLITRDRTSTLWHKLWRYECAMLKLPTLSGIGIADQEPQLPHLVLAALDPIMHEALPTPHYANAQTLSDYLTRFQIPHPDLPSEHVEGFCVEFVAVYQRLRGMEPEFLTAWRLWRTILADTQRPGVTLTQVISGRLWGTENAPDVNHRIRGTMLRVGSILEMAVRQMPA